jgi:type IV secretory pathway VirB9-like protein
MKKPIVLTLCSKLSTIALVAIFILATAPTIALAKDKGACRTIHHKEGRVYEIKTAMYQGTHIRLPDKLLVDPVKGSDLWTAEGDGHHVMVQPNSAEAQGKRTTLTLIDEKNMSYNFKLIRVAENHKFDACVTLKNDPKFFGGNKLSSHQSPNELAQEGLRQQIQVLQSSLQEERNNSEKKIDGILKKYRSFIYTRYSWSGGDGFKGSGVVTDVYDDGRFTFIRVKPDHRGMLALSAKVDGKKEILQYIAESESLYRVSGIYPEFKLKYGKSGVSIKRKDNLNNGVY